jgi:riboflavin synthase
MFTGIVTDVGTIDAATGGPAAMRLRVRTSYDLAAIDIGDSIACNGCCLTVVEKAAGCFAVDASHETLAKTTLSGWKAGRRVNLERALKVGDELGGHIVLGHVDGIAEVTGLREEGGSRRITFTAPRDLAKFIAPKGSVTLDGVSLTVNEVAGEAFGVNIIPHTLAVTTLGELAVGGRANMEIDTVARYVARILHHNT